MSYISRFKSMLGAGTAAGLLTAAAFAGSVQAQPLTLATLPPGAINNLQSTVLAAGIAENSDLELRVVGLPGNAAQMAAVHAGEAEFSLMDTSDATEAFNGTGEFEGRPLTNLRVAFTLFPLPVGFMVRADSDIHTVADLEGKRLPVGWSNFKNGEVIANGVLATAGLSLDDGVGVECAGLLQCADDFIAGRIDGTVFAVGAPKPAEAAAALGGIRFLPIDTSPEAIERMKSVRSEYFAITLPPLPNFAGIDEPTPTMAFRMAILAGAQVDEDTVYELVKTAYESKEQFVAGHPSFNAFNPENMASPYGSLQYHPGAIRFYQEVGIWPGN